MKIKLLDAVKRMHRKYAGDTQYPSPGDEDWQMYVDILNDLKNDWAGDETTKSGSHWEERTFGETNDTDLAYDVDIDVVFLSDYVYIDTTDGRTIRFSVIKEKDRHGRLNCVYLSGQNPQQINFTNMPTAAVGGTIRAGVYFIPPDMTKPTDIVPIDNPLWGIIAGAAELAFNDPSQEDRFPSLNAAANAQYVKMQVSAASLPGNQINAVPTVGFEDPAGGCD